MTTLRCAHFVQRYPPALGGAESYFARVSEFLADRGDEVTVYTTNALDLTAFWSPRGRCTESGAKMENGVQIHRFPLWRMPGRRWLLKPLSFVPHHYWQCLTLPCNPISLPMWRCAGRSNHSFDLVHAAAFPYAFPIACGFRMARRLKIPFLITPFLHLGDPEDAKDPVRRAYTSPALLSLLRAAHCVFVQTPGEEMELLRHGVPAGKIVLQGLGVDPNECTGGNRVQARHEWSIMDDAAIIGHLANNSEEKGTTDLLRAASLSWNKGLRFHVVLAGPEMPNFQHFWRRYVHRDKVIRLGRLDEQAKRNFFAGIDLFALPSRSDSFGLVLLEAWANGKPNVAYRAGGIADVIRHGADGLLIRCGAIQELAAALERLVADSDRCKQLGEAGRQRTATDFVWQDKLQTVRSNYLRAVRASENANDL